MIDSFYDVKDVMKKLKLKQSAAYKVMRKLNKELTDKGFMVRNGLINKKYFKERYGIEEGE